MFLRNVTKNYYIVNILIQTTRVCSYCFSCRVLERYLYKFQRFLSTIPVRFFQRDTVQSASLIIIYIYIEYVLCQLYAHWNDGKKKKPSHVVSARSRCEIGLDDIAQRRNPQVAHRRCTVISNGINIIRRMRKKKCYQTDCHCYDVVVVIIDVGTRVLRPRFSGQLRIIGKSANDVFVIIIRRPPIACTHTRTMIV